MRRGSKCFSLVLSVLLVVSGIWLGSAIQDNAACETKAWQDQSDTRGKEIYGPSGQIMEDVLNHLLILDVAIPPCVAAGFLTAQEIRKKQIQSVNLK